MNKHFNTDPIYIREILAKSLELQTLNLLEVSSLTTLQDKELWSEIFETAQKVKEKVFGKNVFLFAPLYLSNECINNCIYCGFRNGNKKANRKILKVREASKEALLLSNRGYRRLLLVASENPKLAGVDYFEKIINEIYKSTNIRVLSLNAAPMNVEEFKRLKACGVVVYQCFQETYHLLTYRYMHPFGPKANYDWRLMVMDRAIEAGFEDIGMGILLGLYDWRMDVLALMTHIHRLMRKYGFGPRTLSVPRLQPAEGSKLKEIKYKVSDTDFKKIVAIYRLALPYVGVVISTRESPELRDELFMFGVSQISAGAKTSPGGYIHSGNAEQFEIGDKRSLKEVIAKIESLGLIPTL